MELSEDITFFELSEIWLYDVNVYLSYSWQKQQERFVSHLCRFIGDKKVKDIKPLDVDKIIVELSRRNPNTGKPMAKKTLQGLVNTLIRIFDLAIDNDIINKNPASNKKKKIPRSAPTKVVECISDEAQRLIISVKHRAQVASLIMLFCGLRKGEVLALQWSDVDFKRKVISVNKTLQRVGTNLYQVKSGTKNNKTRIVSVPDYLLNFLVNLKKSNNSTDNDYISCQINGSIHTPSSWTQVWKSYNTQLNYIRYAELNPNTKSIFSPDGTPQVLEKINAHQLRHTYATMLYKSGVDLMTASSLLGHSDVKLTLNIYTHLDEKFKQVNISKLNNYINDNYSIQDYSKAE